MTNNRQQFITPETRPEYARIPTLSLAINKILDVLDNAYNIEQFIADEIATIETKERPFVLRAIDYTIKPQLIETADLQTGTASFPSSVQHNLIIQAEEDVKNSFKDDYGLSA